MSFPSYPVIEFGKYKDRSITIDQVPDSYLHFLKKPTAEGEDFSHRGVNWSEEARKELSRRRLIGRKVVDDPLSTEGVVSIDSKGRLESHFDGVKLTPTEVDFSSIDEKRAKALILSESVDVTFDAVNGAASCLLKEFVTRPDKEVLFLTWIVDYLRESVRFGKCIEENKQDLYFQWVYRGTKFKIHIFKSPNPILASIERE